MQVTFLLFLADEDSNLGAPEVRRKPVNRIEDSESDGEKPANGTTSDSEQKSELKIKEDKLQQLVKLFPHCSNTVRTKSIVFPNSCCRRELLKK